MARHAVPILTALERPQDSHKPNESETECQRHKNNEHLHYSPLDPWRKIASRCPKRLIWLNLARLFGATNVEEGELTQCGT
jgi:hypothetical protein